MKQILCRILVLLVVVAAILGLSSCNIFIEQDVTFYDLVVKDFDREVVYGSELDFSGLEIEATTGDDVKYIPVNSSMIVSGDTKTVGAHELEIEYGGFSWTLAYEVFYKVEHIVDGLVYDSQLVSSRDEILYVKDPVKNGSIFLGWSTDMPETLTGNVRREAVFVDNITLPKLSATYGDTLGDITLPTVSGGKWHWQDSTETSVGNAGTNVFKLVYVFDDTAKGELTFDVDVEVAKKHVDIKVLDEVFEYNGKVNTVRYELSEAVPAEDVICFGDIAGTEIGEYSYTIRIFNDNYEGQYSGTFEIEPIDITIAILLLDPSDGVYKSEVIIDYGNSFPEYKIVITDKNGNDYKLDAELSVSKPVLLKAGEHPVTTSFDDEHYDPKIIGATLKVNTVDLDPGVPGLIGAENVVFGDKLSEILFEEHQLGYWEWDLSHGDTVGNAGKNTFTAVFVPKDSSYNEYRYDVELTVNRKQLTFDITSSRTFVFDGKEYGLTYNVIDPNSREVVSGLKVLGNQKFVNAGTHSVTLEFEDKNYQAIENTFTFTISQATIEKDFSFIVDDVWFQGITLSDIPLPEGYKWNNPGIQIGEPGGYSYDATFYPEDQNYATVSGSLAIVLDKATPSLTTDKKAYDSLIYNTSEHKLSGVITHNSNSDMRNNIEYYISGTDEQITGLTNAGTYNIDVVVPESNKYKSAKVSVVVVVNKANPSIDRPVIDGWTFGGEADEPTSGSKQVEIAGFHYYTEECGQYTKLDGVPANAGTYYVTAYSLATDNYNAAESDYRQFVIEKFVVTRPTLAHDVYTGGTLSATVPASTLYKVSENGNPARMNAGTYEVTLELLDSDNYIWNNGDKLTTKVSYVIDKATINLSAITGSNSFKYDDAFDFLSEKTYITEHVTNFGEVVYLYATINNPTVFTEVVPENIGTYLVKAVVYADEANNWKTVETAPFRFEITKKPIPVPELSETTSVFNGDVFKPTAPENEEIYTIEYENENSINKGEYKVTFTIIDQNYKWADGANGERTYTITAATPKIYDVVSGGWTFGTPITHSASAKVTADGHEDYLINVENAVRVVYYNISNKNVPINKPSNAGTYYVRFVVSADNNNGNWVSTSSDYIEFVIEQFALDIPELDGTGVYTFTGSDIPLTVKENNAHKAHYTVSGNVERNVGSYTAVYSLENSNYKWNDETTADKTIDYKIQQAGSSVTGLAITPWTFNDAANTPEYTAKTSTGYTIPVGQISISFRKADSDSWTTISPSEWATKGPHYAGDYYVKVSVASDENNNWATSESTEFKLNIAKDDYDMSGVSWNYTSPFTFNDGDHTVSVTGTLPSGVSIKEYTGNVEENAGTYTANVKFSYDYDNYNEPTLASLEWTINPQIVNKPEADTTEFVYNTTQQKYVLATHSGYTISGNLQTNAGTYEVVVTLNNTETVKNYIWNDELGDEKYTAKTYDFVISPKALETTFVTLANTLEYNETAQTQTVLVKFVNEVLVLDKDYSVTGNVQTDAGDNYKLTVTAKENSNYTGSVVIPYTVARKPLSKPSAATGLAFNNGTLGSGIYTIEGQWTAVDTAEAATVNGVTPAGDYKVTVTLNSNYKWNDGSITPLELPYKIDKATIKLTNLTAQYPEGASSWTFGDTVAYVAYKVDGSQTFGTINYHYLKEGSTEWTDTVSGAGNYTVRASIANDANWYNVTPTYATFTLNTKVLKDSDVTHTYNNLVYTGSVIDGSVTVTVNDKTLTKDTDYTVSIDKTVRNAGDYTITVTGKGNYSGTITKTFNVAKKALSEISTTHTYHNNDAEKTNLVYTGTTFGDRVVLKYGNIDLVKGTDYSISITEDGISADSVKNAGDYVIVVTAAENGNYSGTVTLTFSVDVKKVIAPEFAAGTNTILVYDHNATEANQPKLSDSADADYYGVTYPTFNKNVGTYEIVAALDAIYGDNIKWSDDTVANKTFTYSITEKGISDSDVSHTYNNLIYTGSEIDGTVTVVVNGKTLVKDTDYTLSIDKTVENAGDYIITVVGKGNYKGTVTKNFTVAPAQETVIFSKIAETAGSFANGTLTLTYTGEIDVRNFITATLKKSATAALTNRQPEITGYDISSAGEFTVTYKYAKTDDGNYAEVTGTVKVVINAVTNNNITLTANYVNGTEWRYEDAVKYSASAAFGEIKLVYYKLVDNVYVEMEDFVPGVTILDHGDYKVVATIEENNNYNGDEESIEFKVKKKIITDTAKNSTYDGNPHDSGLKDNDIYTVREHSEDDNTNYGTYYVTATIRDSKLNNYAWADDNNEASKEFEYQIASRANKLEDYKLLDKDGNSVTSWTHEDVISHTANVLHKADGDTLGYVVEYKAQEDYSNDAILYTVGLPTNVGTYVIRFRTTDGNATIEYGTIQNVTISAKNENAPVIAGKTYDNTDYKTGLEDNSVYTVSGVTAKDAGTYTVVLTLVDPDNHKWTLPTNVPENSTYTISGEKSKVLTITYQITTRTVDVESVTASKSEWKFDEENATITPAPEFIIDGVTFTYTYTFYKWNETTEKYDIPVTDADDISDIKNVGKYQVVVALVSAENNANGVKNYEAGQTKSTTFEIKHLVLDEVTLDETSREFNNAEFKPNVNNFNSKYCDTPVYAGADASFKNYGDYTATVSIKIDYVGNVVLHNNENSVELEYSITSATPAIAGLVAGTWTFNENGTGVNHSATVTVPGATPTEGTHYYIVYYVKNGDKYVKYGTDGLTAPENAGTNYSVRVEVKAAENLNWAATNSEYVDFVIAPDTVNAPEVSASRPFNNGTQTSGWVTVNGKWTVVDTGVDATEYGVTRAGNNYTATITLNGNYTWNAIPEGVTNVTIVGQVATVTYSITAIDISTDVDKDAKYKDENGNNLYYTGNKLGSLALNFGKVTLKEGRDYIVSITKDGKPADDVKYAGRYVITVTGKGNYTGTHTFEEFIIDQQTVNVPEFTNANFNYTRSDIYGTYNSSPLYKVDEGNSVSAKYAGEEGYVIFTLENYENYKWGTTENLSGDHNENVKVAFVVAPAPVAKPEVVYKDAQDNIVDGFVYNADNYTITITGVENYMTPDAGNVYTAQSANTYTVKYTLDPNYEWNDGDTNNYVELTWTIATDNNNEVNIFLGENVAENGKVWTYGDSIVYTASHKYGTLDVTYINNETGEKAVFVNGTLPVGSYTASATLTVEGHNNYNGGSASVTFTVKAADSTVDSIEMSDWVGENVKLEFDSTPTSDTSKPKPTVTANGVSVKTGITLWWASYSPVSTVNDEASDTYENLVWYEWTETNYPKNAGTYLIKVEVAADTNGNYHSTVKYFDTEDQLIKISPKPVDAPTIDGKYVYSEVNGVAKSHEIKFINYNKDYMSNDAVVQTQASSYKVTIKLVGTNHVWKEGTKVNADGDVELTWTISSANDNVCSLVPDRPEDKTSWIHKDKVSYTASATYGTISIKYYRIVNGVETELKDFIPGETILDAGDYKVVATFETSTNWNNLEPITIEFNVEQIVADTTVIDKEQEAVYNNKVLDVIDLPTNVTGGEWKLYTRVDNGDGTYTYVLVTDETTVGGATGEGEYNVFYARFESTNVNYASTNYIDVKISVAKAPIEIKVPTIADSDFNFIFTFEDSNYVDSVKSAIKYTATDGKVTWGGATTIIDKGEYELTLTIGEGSNHLGATETIKVKVNPASISAVLGSDLTYIGTAEGATEQTQTITVIGVAKDKDFKLGTDYEVTSLKATVVGTYNVTVTGKGNYEGAVWTGSYQVLTKYVTAPSWPNGTQPQYTFGDTFTAPVPTNLVDLDYYTVTSPAHSTNAGTYTYVVTLKSEHGSNIAWAEGTIVNANKQVELSYVINPKALADGNVIVSDVTYDGNEHRATVKDGETLLVKDTDYEITYSTSDFTSAGTITVTVTGTGNYSGTITKTYEIKQKSLEDENVTASLSGGNVTYDGNGYMHTITVTVGKTTLTENTDYTVSYKRGDAETNDFTNAGTITVTVTGTGNYTGTIEKTYKINKAKAELSGLNGSYSVYANKTEVNEQGQTVKKSLRFIDEVISLDEILSLSDITVTVGSTTISNPAFSLSYKHAYKENDPKESCENIYNAGYYELVISLDHQNYEGSISVLINVAKGSAEDILKNRLGNTATTVYYQNLLGTLVNDDFLTWDITTTFAEGKDMSSAIFHAVIDDSNLNYASGEYTLYFKKDYDINNKPSPGAPGMTFYTVARLGDFSTGTPYGTVEAALGDATSGTTVWIMPISNLEGQIPDGYNGMEGAITITSNATIKNGVTLILPQNANGDRNSDGLSDGSFSTGLAGSNTCRTKLVIANGAVLTVNGTLEINGVMAGGASGGKYAGSTYGDHAELVIQGSGQIICNGVIRASGYITSDYGTYRPTDDKPSILINSGAKIYQPFMLYDYQSGNYFAAVGYNEFNGKNPMTELHMTPFNETGFYNVQPFMRINHGGQMLIWANLDTSKGSLMGFEYGGPQHTEAIFIGSETSHFLQLKSGSYITTEIKDPATAVATVNIYGGMKVGEFKLNITVAVIDASATTKNSFFPLSWAYDVTLHNGTYELQDQMLKLMWGAKLTVASDAILDASKTSINVYDLDDLATLHNKIATQTTGPNNILKYGWSMPESIYKHEGKLTVNGTLIANAIGGKVYAEGAGASITVTTPTVSSNESVSYTADKFSSVLNEIHTITNSLELVGNGTISSAITRPMLYNGEKWVYGVRIDFDVNSSDANMSTESVVVETDKDATTVTAPSNDKLPVPTRNYYKFDGWYMDPECTNKFDSETIPSSYVLKVYAKWTPLEYTIKYEDVYDDKYGWNDENKLSAVPSENGKFTVETVENLPSVSSGEVTKFKGWYYLNENGERVFIGNVVGNTLVNYLDVDNTVTLYAYWTQEKIYTIKFENDKTAGNTASVSPESGNWDEIRTLKGSLTDLSSYDSNKNFRYYGAEYWLDGAKVTTWEEIIAKLNEGTTDYTVTIKWNNKTHITIGGDNGSTNNNMSFNYDSGWVIIKNSTDFTNYISTYISSKNPASHNTNTDIEKYFLGLSYSGKVYSSTEYANMYNSSVYEYSILGSWTDKQSVTITKTNSAESATIKVAGHGDVTTSGTVWYPAGSTLTITVNGGDKNRKVTDYTGATLSNGVYTLTGNATFTISAEDDWCLTSDTLVTLADGTQKRIDQVTFDDKLLVWDFNNGEYAVVGSTIIENHGYGMRQIIKLVFEDGTVVKIVNKHGFFDVNLNKWVDISADNVDDYIGHSFTQVDGNSYKSVKLNSAEITVEYAEAWSILTADHYNCIVEGMFSITPPATEQLAFFEIGEGMKYDEDAKQATIEKYGLYTYEEFAHLLTKEQFDALNVAEIKIAVGKGLITYEEILWLIATYIHN